MRAGGINARSEAIVNLDSAIAKFGQSCSERVRSVLSDVDSSIAFVESEISGLDREIDGLRDSIRYADEEEDTSLEESRLQEAYDEKSDLKRSKREIESAANVYLAEARRFEFLCSSHTAETRNYLRGLVGDLSAYFSAGGDLSGGSGSISSIGSSRSGESISRSEQDRISLRKQEGNLALEAMQREFDSRLSDNPDLRELSLEEFVSLYRYSQHDFEQMNYALRSSDSHELDTYGPKIRLASSGLKKLPKFEGEVFRGAKSGEYLRNYTLGEIVEEEGFTSTSSRSELRLPGDVEFFISSKSGRDISSLSALGSKEAEVLFPPGTRFMVIDRTDDATGTKIALQEIDS